MRILKIGLMSLSNECYHDLRYYCSTCDNCYACEHIASEVIGSIGHRYSKHYWKCPTGKTKRAFPDYYELKNKEL